MTVPIPVQIKCVQRELKMRRQVYARRVAERKMQQSIAAYEIATMEAVLATLQAIDAGERLI